jgi:hypothetical protein
MRDQAQLFAALSKSAFRSRFQLQPADLQYLKTKGLDTIMTHAADFVHKRLSDAHPKNDGKQTPFRGHPVFIAQHATACCCRSCLEKWHHISQGVTLTSEQERYIVKVLQAWLEQQIIKFGI